MPAQHSNRLVLNPRHVHVAMVAAALLAILIRLPFLSWQLEVDEAAYAYTTHWWARGYTLYSEDLWLDRAQGIFLIYRLGMALFGKATWAIRLWGAFWAAGATVAVYLVARRLFDHGAALAASTLFALFSAAPHIQGYTVNGEILMALPATLSAYFLLARRPTWAGVAASVAVLVKPSAASAYLLAAAWFIHRRASWREWTRFGLGAIIPIFLSAAHGAATVGLERYAYAVALFELGPAWGPHTDVWKVALDTWVLTGPVWLPLGLLAIPTLRRAQRTSLVFMLFWTLSSLAGMAMGGRWFAHYFTQLMPALATWAGAGLVQVWRHRSRWARYGAVALALIYPLLFEAPFVFLAEPRSVALGYRIANEVADHVRTHTTEEETIYVAHFQPIIYYQAQRRSAIPYLFPVHLEFYPGALDCLVETVESRKPTYVLFLNPGAHWLDPEGRFAQALEEGYRVETSFSGVPLYRRK